MIKIRSWQAQWVNHEQRKRATPELPGVGFSIQFGFLTKAAAEAALSRHPKYPGDGLEPHDVTEVEHDLDEEAVVTAMLATKASGRPSSWLVLHEPGDAFGLVYADCARVAGVKLEYHYSNGDTHLKVIP